MRLRIIWFRFITDRKNREIAGPEGPAGPYVAGGDVGSRLPPGPVHPARRQAITL
jgi:hypothetical protein